MNERNPTARRITSAPGDVTTAALLALGAFAERRGRLRTHRAWIAAVPIVLVNYVAFRAQLRFWEAHLDHADAVLTAIALESIAVYLAWQAHVAQLADDSALRLRLAAYGTALVIGALNYSHYMRPGWRPTVAAVTFGLLSAISPWLWSIHSRRESRDALKAKNLIEDHAVRLGATRWTWHLYRCVKVMWAATWTGETRPAEAIALIRTDPVLEASGTADVTEPDLRRDPAQRPVRQRPAPRQLTRGRVADLKAVAEQELILALGATEVLPSVRSLAGHEKLAGHGSEATRKRAARRVLEAVAAERNGGSHGDGHGA